jgi:phage shock protein PspC (stress-responsive transcriptional regulator)
VYRPDEGRWGAGVAAALARRGNVDPVLVRGIFVALTFAGGLGVGAYGVAWLLLPQQDGRIHLQEAVHGRFTAGFAGAAIGSLALLGDPGPWNDGGWPGGPSRVLAWILLIALIWWLLRHRHDDARDGWGHGQTDSPTGPGMSGYGASGPSASGYGASGPSASGYGASGYGASATAGEGDVPVYGSPPWQTQWTPPVRVPDPSWPSRRITRITLGLALLAAAAVLIADRSDGMTDAAGLVAAAAALGVVALGILTAGALGRRSGGLAGIGVLLAAGVLIGAGVHEAGVQTGQNIALAGDYTWRPATAEAARKQYNLGAGQAELVLTNPGLLSAATTSAPLTVTVRVGVGQLTVVLPESGARVVTDLGAGQVTDPDGTVHEVGTGNHRVTFAQQDRASDLPVLIVDVQQGAGEVLVKESRNA